MKHPMFTPEELAELAAYDAEVDEDQSLTMEEIRESRARDRESVIDNMDHRWKRIADYQRAYYDANKERIAEQKRAYYDANKERIADYQRAYYDANKERIADYQRAYYQDPQRREAHNAWMREYNRKKREAQRKKTHEAEARV